METARQSLNLAHVLAEIQKPQKVQIGTGSGATRGMTARLGVGRVRHLETQYLWIQERTRSTEIIVVKVRSEVNTADLLTKALDAERHWTLMSALR